MTELRFDMIQMIRSKMVLLTMLFALIIAGLNFGYQSYQAYRIPIKFIDQYGEYNNVLQMEVQESILKMQDRGDSQDTIAQYIGPPERMLYELNQAFMAIDVGDREALTHHMIEFYRTYEDYQGRLSLSSRDEVGRIALFNRLDQMDILYEDESLLTAPPNFVEIVSRRLMGLPILMIALFYFMFAMGSDQSRDNDLLRNTQPIAKWKRMASKGIVAFLMTITSIFLILLFSYGIALLLGSKGGSWNYPSVQGTLELFAKPVLTTVLWKTVSRLLLSIPGILLVGSLVLLFKQVFKETHVLATILFVLVAAVDAATKSGFENAWTIGIESFMRRPYNPFRYPYLADLSPDQRPAVIVMILFTGLVIAVLWFLAIKLSNSARLQTWHMFKGDVNLDQKMQRYARKGRSFLTNLSFECKKIIKSRKFQVAAMLLMVVLMMFSMREFSISKERKDSISSVLTVNIESEESLIQNNEKSSVQQIHRANLEKLKSIRSLYDRDRQKGANEYINYNFHQTVLEPVYQQRGYTYASADIHRGMLKYLMENELPVPISLSYGLPITPFDQLRDWGDRQYVDEITRGYLDDSGVILNHWLSGLSVILGLIPLIFVVATGLSSERQGKNIDLLNTQPVSSSRIYGSIIGAKMLVFSMTLLIAIFFSIIAMTGMGAKTNLDYTTIHYRNGDPTEDEQGVSASYLTKIQDQEGKEEHSKQTIAFGFRSIITENIEMIVLILLGVGVMIVFAGILSFGVRSPWACTLLTCCFFGIGYLLTSAWTGAGQVALPIQWFNIGGIASGITSINNNQNLYSSLNGWILLSIYMVGLTLLGIYIYRLKFRKGGRA